MNEKPKKSATSGRRSYNDMTRVLTVSVGFDTTVVLLRDCSGQQHSPE